MAYGRWTADTEQAFLLALRMTGRIAEAAATIGRTTSSCHNRRDRVPAFRQAWEDALAARENDRLAKAVAVRDAAGVSLAAPLSRTRVDGWTAQRQRAFCRALAHEGNYRRAAAAVGLSYESVRKMRHRSPEFQAMCDKALVEGGTTVEEAAYVRAVEGWEEPVIHNGQVVGYRRRFSDVLAKTLLERREGAPARDGRNTVKSATPAEIDRELMRRLDALAARRKRQDKAALNAWAEDMARKGWAP